MAEKGWIGVDLDGTLAEYDGWRGPRHIGRPVPKMVAKVKRRLAQGQEVRIFTARVTGAQPGVSVDQIRAAIQDWTEEHLGKRLEVTNEKDWDMVEFWDDRARQVQTNTGTFVRCGRRP